MCKHFSAIYLAFLAILPREISTTGRIAPNIKNFIRKDRIRPRETDPEIGYPSFLSVSLANRYLVKICRLNSSRELIVIRFTNPPRFDFPAIYNIRVPYLVLQFIHLSVTCLSLIYFHLYDFMQSFYAHISRSNSAFCSLQSKLSHCSRVNVGV